MVYYSNESLYHHGILGQKWGVRRYQNPDGSLTSAGRKRYGVKEKAINAKNSSISFVKTKKDAAVSKVKNMSPETKKKIVIGTAATAATVAVGAYLYTHPDKIISGAAYVSSKLFSAKNATPLKVSNITHTAVKKGKEAAARSLKKAGQNIIKETKRTALRAGGAVALKKIKDEYEKNVVNNKNLDPYSKEALKSIYDDAVNDVRSKTMRSGSNKGDANSGGGNYNEKYRSIKQSLGSPNSNNRIDKQTPEWQNFINSINDVETKRVVKSLANDGYSYDQLRKAIS